MKNGIFLIVTFALLSFSFKEMTIASQLPRGIYLTKEGKNYIINFSLPEIAYNTVEAEGELYYRLNVNDYGKTSAAGLPELPIVSFNLFIPVDDQSASVEELQMMKETIMLEHKVYPAQYPWEKTNPFEERPFIINRSYYGSTGEMNNPFVKISEPFIIAGIKGVIVTLYPFSYNPVENKLVVVKSGTVRVKLEREYSVVQNLPDDMNNFLKEIFVNYDYPSSMSTMNYLIITAPSYESSLTSFVNHKTSRGYNVSVYNTNATGTTNTAIKSFIQQKYNDPLQRPEFILLVGDVGNIPAWVGSGEGNPTTDLNYALLEGSDYFADAFIGRFSVSSVQQLQNAINKIIYMEGNIGVLPKKNVFMASEDNWNISEGTHNYVISNYFGPAGYTNLKLYSHTYNATTAQLIAALNDNQLFAIYSGHGGETSWADGPPLNQSQVNGLTNNFIYPFVYSFACVTGSYQISECFGETWLRTTNGGSAFYGSSVNSYWDEDDILEKGVFKAMFVDELTKITPMFNKGKIYLVNHYGGITPTVLRYLEMYNLMGDPSLPTVLQIPPDNTPPDPITDLSVVDPTSNSLTLNWSAPFDSTYGGIKTYDIRYSLSPINNDDDFNNANQILYTGNSDSAGTPKSFIVENLNFNTLYYFAIKAKDMWNNTSLMSNVSSRFTYEAPLCSINPDSVEILAQPDTSYTGSVTISNISTGNSTLDYSIELTNNTFPEKVFIKLNSSALNQSTRMNASKNNPAEIYGLSFKGSGGPDLFGYQWIDSNEPGGPDYVWQDITSSGTLVSSWVPTGSFDAKDEGYAGPFPIGFNFKFYGNIKTQIYVSTNGLIAFSPITTDIYSNTEIPNSSIPNEFIAPFWDDLDGRTQGTVHYKQFSDRFVIQFTNWQRYSTQGSLTFQIVLRSNNRIHFYYNNLNATTNAATVGIENASGSYGLQIAYNAVYLQNSLAVLIAADPEWLTATPMQGTIYNGNAVDVILNFNTEGLQLGEYSMDMETSTNDPLKPLVIIPIRMIVTNEVPVELTSFTAVSADNEVRLTWITQTETNNKGFYIERKNISEKSWSIIGFINGNGTTTNLCEYYYVDRKIGSGKYTYRLKQVDLDGSFEYSQQVNVEVNTPDKFELFQNYPNPFNPSTLIKFSLPEKEQVNLNVYNISGELVQTLINQRMDEGYYEVIFSAVNFASGVYYYTIRAGSFIDTKKMIIIK
jgi:hypothetical protein